MEELEWRHEEDVWTIMNGGVSKKKDARHFCLTSVLVGVSIKVDSFLFMIPNLKFSTLNKDIRQIRIIKRIISIINLNKNNL